MDNDTLLFFGGEVKSLGGGKVGGYLIRFTDKNRKDLSGEYFTDKTYLGPHEGDGAECLFDHGLPIPLRIKSVDRGTVQEITALAEHTFAPIKTKRDAVGIWAETVLNLADEYEAMVHEIAKKGKLGWSSGASGYRVKKNADGEILRWPIGEGSLTFCPCEPDNRTMPVKSLSEWLQADDDTKAVWSTAFQNNLPDSSFAYIESGGKKDGEGKTEPRSLRHFPYKDADGKPDEAHVRNALARIPQSKVSDAAKKTALAKIKAAAKALGIDVADGKSLAGRLTQLIEDRVEDAVARDGIIKQLAREALIEPATVEQILNGASRATHPQLKAFARVLEVPYEQLKEIAAKGRARTIKDAFGDAVAEEMAEGLSACELWGILCEVVCDIATMTKAATGTGTDFDMPGKVTEAVNTYAGYLVTSIIAQIKDWASGDDDTSEMYYDPDAFHLKSLARLDTDLMRLVTKSIAIEEHLQMVVTAEEDLVARFTANADKPRGKSTKAGRELSDKNRQRLMKMKESHKQHSDQMQSDMQGLLDSTQPKADESAKNAALMNHLRRKFERRGQLGA